MKSKTRTYAQAIAQATMQAMALDPSVIVIGQGTRDSGQVFGSLEGVFQAWGEKRVIEMPLSEGAMAGVCVGAALSGLRPVYVLQRADFSFLVLDQIVNHAAKYHFMFGGQVKVPLTLRLIVGKGWGQGPQHSQSVHATLSHFPGLRVATPSDPYSAKGILLNSIFSDDPAIIIEGRPLYSLTQDIPEDPYTIPFGKANVLQKGSDVTIIAVSFLVPEAAAAGTILAQEGIKAEVIDVVCPSPLDVSTLTASASKTGRVLIVDSSWSFCGLSAEISAILSERLFGKLKAPVERLTFPPSPTPTAENLERQFYPTSREIIKKCQELVTRKR